VTGTQLPPRESAFRIKRAWGAVLTPLGVIAAGRMGSDWGLGMATNGGDCPDCNTGDAADRVAFITSLGGHFWALAYDFSAVGPATRRNNGGSIDFDPSDDVRTFTFAFLSASPTTRANGASTTARPPPSTAPTSPTAGRTRTSRPTTSPSPSTCRSPRASRWPAASPRPASTAGSA